MRSGPRIFSLALAWGAFLLPCIAFGQTNTRSEQTAPRQQFTEINASLLEAANTVFDKTYASPAKMHPTIYAPQSEAPASVSSPLTIPSRSTPQVEALRPVVQPILSEEGVPDELAAVIQVESGGNPAALSSKGARGLWQLMPDTARRYGLRVDARFDERLDLEKATRSAARYLRDLYSQFGSWPLALAAYNTGELNLQRAIDRSGSRDFPTLSKLGYLPAETRNYVPMVLAAMRSRFSSIVLPGDNARPAHFVYATSGVSGQ
jgi:hypothetical protein